MCSTIAPIGLNPFAPEQPKRDNEKCTTNVSFLITKIFRSRRASVSSSHKRNATHHDSQRTTHTSHRPTRRYWGESQSRDHTNPHDRTASSVEVREVFDSLDGVNEATKGRANFEMCTCDEVMCRRARTKILEYANNSEPQESSWTRYIKTIEKPPSRNEKSFERISEWINQEIEVQRAVSLSKERVAGLNTDLAWLRANHPFLMK